LEGNRGISVFIGDKDSSVTMVPFLQRVLIADPQPASARLLVDMMRDIARSYCWVASDMELSLKIAATCGPQLIVVEIGAAQFDGLAFTRAVRRSP